MSKKLIHLEMHDTHTFARFTVIRLHVDFGRQTYTLQELYKKSALTVQSAAQCPQCDDGT